MNAETTAALLLQALSTLSREEAHRGLVAALVEARQAGREEAAAHIDVPYVREGREFAAAIRGMAVLEGGPDGSS